MMSDKNNKKHINTFLLIKSGAGKFRIRSLVSTILLLVCILLLVVCIIFTLVRLCVMHACEKVSLQVPANYSKSSGCSSGWLAAVAGCCTSQSSPVHLVQFIIFFSRKSNIKEGLRKFTEIC